MRETMSSLPRYICKRASGPIQIDGKLDEASWGRAEAIRLRLADTGGTPCYATEARLLWDDEHLYVGFQAEDPDIWATMRERDAELWHEDVVEVFIDANGSGCGYHEFEFNPLGAVLDLFVLTREATQEYNLWFGWNSDGLKHAVAVDGTVDDRTDVDRSWTVEAAIPLKDILTAPNFPPRDGDLWRVNLYRIERGRGGKEYSAWSPPGENNFNHPSKFGELIFSVEKV